MKPTPLLTAKQMQAADAATIAAGTSASELMQRAGTALAHIIQSLYAPCHTVVMCGKGNNGGDGRIAAELLKQAGFEVLVTTPDEDYREQLQSAELIVDALLGTGLNAPVAGKYWQAIEAMNEIGCPIVAVDIPSGINASTGEIMGTATRAAHTVTFASAKCGHYLLPGKAHTGLLHIMDIGITEETIANTNPHIFLNTAALWEVPEPQLTSHKYTRGAVLVQGGPLAMTGASKLAATAALKIGAGAVSIICNNETLPVYAAMLTAVMTKPANTMQEFQQLIDEPRVRALLIGPGAGVSNATNERAHQILQSNKPCVLDADALVHEVLARAHAATVLTPHQGEFERLFGHYPNKLDAASAVTKHFPGVLVYKGSDTVIAQQGKPIVINANAPPTLATAGSGDVLAGIIAGLLAQGMEPFDAACAGVWLHGHAAQKLGRFFTAEDLVENL